MKSMHLHIGAVLGAVLFCGYAEAAVIKLQDHDVQLSSTVGFAYVGTEGTLSQAGDIRDFRHLELYGYVKSYVDADYRDRYAGTQVSTAANVDNGIFARTKYSVGPGGWDFYTKNDNYALSLPEDGYDVFNSAYTRSKITVDTTFTVLNGSAQMYLSGYSALLTDFTIYLEDLTAGTILADIFTDNYDIGTYLLEQDHTYKFILGIDNHNLGDTSSGVSASFFGAQMDLPAPGGALMIAGGLAWFARVRGRRNATW